MGHIEIVRPLPSTEPVTLLKGKLGVHFLLFSLSHVRMEEENPMKCQSTSHSQAYHLTSFNKYISVPYKFHSF